MLILAAASLLLWCTVLLAPWAAWRCRERLEAPEPGGAHGAPPVDLAVLIPARDEAAVIGDTLRALQAAAPDTTVILVDDQSRDGTAAIARRAGLRKLEIIRGSAPPPGWAGKLWALQQALDHTSARWLLLLDADIRLAPGLLPALRRKAGGGFALVSVCAEPCWQGLAARWLFPAFVLFFKFLYPFALANAPGSRVAAAAGGVVLVERRALVDAGGFAAWRDAIIDDCTLARHLKRAGYRCWIGLTRGATSLRREGSADILRMVSRSAYVQLHESLALTLLATALLLLAFWVPVLAAIFGSGAARLLGALAWLALAGAYVPVLVYYRRNLLAAPGLPLAASAFLLATWHSAWRALGGTVSQWKGRSYRRGTG